MANLVTFAKKLWKDATSGGTPITAAELNRMEGGINDCATQINRLWDSVSHIDNDISLRKAYLRNTSVLHLTGTDHQSYLMMSIHGICLIVSQGSQDPTVAKLSGVDVTAKRGSANNILDVTFKNGGVTALIISPSDFTVTVS